MSMATATAPNAELRVRTPRGWRDGERLERELRRAKGSSTFVWADLSPEDEEATRGVEQLLGLARGTIVAAEARRLRNHVDLVEGVEIVVLPTLALVRGAEDGVRRGEVTCLVTDKCAVTVESGGAGVLAEAREILESDVAHLELGSLAVLRAVVIAAVERVEQLVVDLGETITQLEKEVFSARGVSSVHEIYRLKRENTEAHRGLAPLSSALRRLADDATTTLPRPARGVILSLAAAADRCVEQVDSFDAALGAMLSAHLTLVSVRQNGDMRRISAWASLVAVPTMFAGLYGMNFRNMPGLDAAWGYPVALVAMGIVCVVLYLVLKRFRWF